MLSHVMPWVCLPGPNLTLPPAQWMLLMVPAVVVQEIVLAILAPKRWRTWPGILRWIMGAIALVGTGGALAGLLRIRAQLDYFDHLCDLHISPEQLQSIEQAYDQAANLSQQFQRFSIVPIAVLALSVIVGVSVLIATRRGEHVITAREHE